MAHGGRYSSVMQSALGGLRNLMENEMVGQEHVMVFPDGSKLVSFNGAKLELRADGSHRWSNVQPDSEIYLVMNEAANARTQEDAARVARLSVSLARSRSAAH
jgi:hypothetical protein